jgi:hypothetical protein
VIEKCAPERLVGVFYFDGAYWRSLWKYQLPYISAMRSERNVPKKQPKRARATVEDIQALVEQGRLLSEEAFRLLCDLQFCLCRLQEIEDSLSARH